MERIKTLGRVQKGILLLMLAMALVFAVLYHITISRVGFAYQDTILVPSQEGDSVVYSGKIYGQQARFTVSQDKSVLFQCGERTYGPYTAREDPTAIPEGDELAEYMTGVELRQGEDLEFRGAVFKYGDIRTLYREDGSLETDSIMAFVGDSYGTLTDENGNVIDSMEPSVLSILDVMDDPAMTHKGEWYAWGCAVLICIVNALAILFADELFRWNLSFQIRDPDRAEPSDWELAGRYIAYTVLLIAALLAFMMGLQ